MNEETLVKLASVLDEDEFVELIESLEKTGGLTKEAEVEYALGEIAGLAFQDELEKIASAVLGEEDFEKSASGLDKLAEDYEELGRQAAREYFVALVKQAEEEIEKEEGEGSEGEGGESSEDESEEASKEEKLKKAKEKLMAAVAAKQGQ